MKKLSIIIYLLWGICLAYVLPRNLELSSSLIPGWHISYYSESFLYLCGSFVGCFILGYLILKRKDPIGFLLFLLHFLFTLFSIFFIKDPFYLYPSILYRASDKAIEEMNKVLLVQQYATTLFFTTQLLYLIFLIRMYRKGDKKNPRPGIQVKDK